MIDRNQVIDPVGLEQPHGIHAERIDMPYPRPAEAAAYETYFGCPVRFGERAAFHRSSASGEVAMEAEPEGKAAAEVGALWQWLTGELALPA